MKAVEVLAGCLTIALVTGADVARSAHDLPLIGSYTQDTPCKGDGSDPTERQIKILAQKIVSEAGTCTFLN